MIVIGHIPDPNILTTSLSEFLGRKTPRQLQRIIRFLAFPPFIFPMVISRQNNEKMFNVFIEFPKPIIAAVNGPGIGEIFLPALWSSDWGN